MSASEAVYVYRDDGRAGEYGAWRCVRVVGDVTVGDEPLPVPVLATTREAIDAARGAYPDAVSIVRRPAGELPQPTDQLAAMRKALDLHPGPWSLERYSTDCACSRWRTRYMLYDRDGDMATTHDAEVAQYLLDLRGLLAGAIEEIERLRGAS